MESNISDCPRTAPRSMVSRLLKSRRLQSQNVATVKTPFPCVDRASTLRTSQETSSVLPAARFQITPQVTMSSGNYTNFQRGTNSVDAAWLAVKGGEDPSKRILRSGTLSQDSVEVNTKVNSCLRFARGNCTAGPITNWLAFVAAWRGLIGAEFVAGVAQQISNSRFISS